MFGSDDLFYDALARARVKLHPVPIDLGLSENGTSTVEEIAPGVTLITDDTGWRYINVVLHNPSAPAGCNDYPGEEFVPWLIGALMSAGSGQHVTLHWEDGASLWINGGMHFDKSLADALYCLASLDGWNERIRRRRAEVASLDEPAESSLVPEFDSGE
jgi:hypothetical protein